MQSKKQNGSERITKATRKASTIKRTGKEGSEEGRRKVGNTVG